MRRHAIWIFLALSLSLLLSLTGCGSEKQGNSSTPSEHTQNASITPTVPSTPVKESSNNGEPTTKPANSVPVTSGDTLSTQTIGWGLSRNSNHQTPGVPASWVKLLEKYNGYYVGDTSGKNVYLTFDEGYENGYTSTIIDILNREQVKAAFFVTRPYIKSHPDLVKRMVEGGYAVGNHTSTHPNLAPLSSAAITKEIEDTAQAFKEVTGEKMPHFLRPPMGDFSEHSLAVTSDLGYKTIFWSFAHHDWDPQNQPGKDKAYQMVMENIHPGAILLLHAVSQSDTEALPDIIRDLKAQGYTFRSLDELPAR